MKERQQVWLPIVLVCLARAVAGAQPSRVQCPASTLTHPAAGNNAELPCNGPTQLTIGPRGYGVPSGSTVHGAINCQQVSGGDGCSTMAEGRQINMFSFGPLSGLSNIAKGLPGTKFANIFNLVYPGTLFPGGPAATDRARSGASVGGPALLNIRPAHSSSTQLPMYTGGVSI
jgi:hypothetical protein